MALEQEALFLQKAVRTKLLEPEVGTNALFVYSELKKRGAQFSFGDFLVERGLLTTMALSALEDESGRGVQTVSRLGDYELDELIGEGPNGVVYRARQVMIDRLVAVKILNAGLATDPEALERFKHEARATGRLNHPNVVRGIDVASDQGLHYFVMELVEGGSARKLMLEAGGKLDETTTLTILRQAAEGLRAVHAAGLVHRDLKPDNILLTPEGQAKLVDLGISQIAPRAAMPPPAPAAPAAPVGRSGRPRVEAQPGQTDGAQEPGGGEFWASAPYAAPEVILGVAEDDPRADIYSLGATFFELLAGRPPFLGNSPQEILRAHLSAPVPDLLTLRPDVSIQTASLVKRMLAKKPDERTPSAAAVVDALTRLLAAKTHPPPPPRPAPQAPARAPGVHAARLPSGLHGTPQPGGRAGIAARPIGAAPGLQNRRPAPGTHAAKTAPGSSRARPGSKPGGRRPGPSGRR